MTLLLLTVPLVLAGARERVDPTQETIGALPPLRNAEWGVPVASPPRPEGCRHNGNASYPWICRERIGGRMRDVWYAVDEQGALDVVAVNCDSRAGCYGLLRGLEREWGAPVQAGTTLVPDDLAYSWTSDTESANWIYTPAERSGALLMGPHDGPAYRALWQTMRTGWREHVIGQPRRNDADCALVQEEGARTYWACSDTQFDGGNVALAYDDDVLDHVGLPCMSATMCLQLMNRIEWAVGARVLDVEPGLNGPDFLWFGDVWSGFPTAADFALQSDASSGSLIIRATVAPAP